MDNCIFCKIVKGDIPAKKVYEDELVMAFHDINPAAPVHILVIPKAHLVNLYDAEAAHEAALGRMMAVAGKIARENGATDGFRTIINNGNVAHQEVMHLHMHIFGGPNPLGPMLKRQS